MTRDTQDSGKQTTLKRSTETKVGRVPEMTKEEELFMTGAKKMRT